MGAKAPGASAPRGHEGEPPAAAAPAPDPIDLRILALLQANPRISVSKMAREVGLTDNAVRYRVRRMEDRGIIRDFMVVVDPAAVGQPVLGMALAQLRDPRGLPALMERAPQVVGAYRCAGAHNACLFLRAADDVALARAVEELCMHPEVERCELLRVEHSYKATATLILPGAEGPRRFQAEP